MEEKEIDSIIQNLISERHKFWKAEAVEDFLKSQNINLDDKELLYQVLNRLIRDDIFIWLDFISSKLPILSSDKDEFIQLLANIAEKVVGDLAQGSYIKNLVSIGSSDPNLGLKLFEKIIATKNELLIPYAGLILGGVGQVQFDPVFDHIKEQIDKVEPRVKLACVRAIRVIFEKEPIKREGDVFKILNNLSKEANLSLKLEVASAYLDFYKYNSKECYENLNYIIKQQIPEINFRIAERVWMSDLPKEDIIKILKILSYTSDKGVLTRVAIALSSRGKEFPLESLQIIKRWVLEGKYFEIRDLGYTLNEIGTSNISVCIDEILSWIESEKEERFRFFIPIILKELSRNNFNVLIEYLEKWIDLSTQFKLIVVSTISEILSFPSKDLPVEIINDSFRLLKRLATDSDKAIQKSIAVKMHEIFGQRPRFAGIEKIIEILREWVADSNWCIRLAIIDGLWSLARDKIDSKQSATLQRNKETKEIRFTALKIEKVELPEGVESYNLLSMLTEDKNEEVKKYATQIFESIKKYLAEKEKKIKEGTYSLGEKSES